jgi:glycosyltransferase involved in cell wall biosynthesis
LKILHVIANLAPRYGGPAKACVAMAQAVARLGHEVSIYTTNQDGPGELAVPLMQPVRQGEVEISYFPIQQPRFWGTSWPLAQTLARKLKEVDLCHIHSLYLFHDLVAGHYCRAYRLPYLIRPHGTLDPYIHGRHRWRKAMMESWFENRNIRKAAALHFTSEEEMRLAAPYIGNAPGAVVPLGVDLREFEPMPHPGRFRERYPEIGDKKIILFLGRINFKKGLDLLVQALARVVRRRRDLHLVLVGPDDDGWGARVKEWLAREGIPDCATFTGMLLGEEKLAALRDAQMFVLSSYSENFGLAVIEAMACGLPVVISDRVNIWREVAAAEAGVVVPCEAEPLAAALERLAESPDLAAAMGRRGQALVARRFQWDSIAQALQDLYCCVIAKQGSLIRNFPIVTKA